MIDDVHLDPCGVILTCKWIVLIFYVDDKEWTLKPEGSEDECLDGFVDLFKP